MFDFRMDKKILYIIIAVMVLIRFTGMTQNGLIALLLVIPGVLIAITFHEFAHAFVADKLGDTTPRSQGRLNLNPLSHMDPIGTVMLLVAGFGWGKPVEINPRNFNNKMSASAAQALVSLAGPIMNFLLAFIFLTITYIVFPAGGILTISTNVSAILYIVLLNIVITNVGLGVFNLIPLPPLDGSKILKHFLPYNAKRWFEEKEQIFYIVFVILWITGLSGIIVSPLINGVYNGMNYLLGIIF